MGSNRSNIETAARAICAMQMAATSVSAEHLNHTIDRLWHIVAAQLEAGIIDESGEYVEGFNVEAGLDAVNDWRSRNPDHLLVRWRSPESF